jgi:hypothetical protein
MAASKTHRGFRYNPETDKTEILFNGTKVADFDASAFASAKALAVTGGITATTGDAVVTAGDARVTAGNVRLGAVSAFVTTEPTSAIVFKQGTAFAGAITTSSGIMSNGTLLRKIIADGTVSNVG